MWLVLRKCFSKYQWVIGGFTHRSTADQYNKYLTFLRIFAAWMLVQLRPEKKLTLTFRSHCLRGFESAVIKAVTCKLSYVSPSAGREATNQSKMKLLSLDGTQVWTVKANTLIADAHICFDYLKVPKKDQNFGRQGWRVHGAGIPVS